MRATALVATVGLGTTVAAASPTDNRPGHGELRLGVDAGALASYTVSLTLGSSFRYHGWS